VIHVALCISGGSGAQMTVEAAVWGGKIFVVWRRAVSVAACRAGTSCDIDLPCVPQEPPSGDAN